MKKKKERTKRFKSLTSEERKKLILRKMKDKGIPIGSGVLNKEYDNEEIYQLIHITNCFPELRNKKGTN